MPLALDMILSGWTQLMAVSSFAYLSGIRPSPLVSQDSGTMASLQRPHYRTGLFPNQLTSPADRSSAKTSLDSEFPLSLGAIRDGSTSLSLHFKLFPLLLPPCFRDPVCAFHRPLTGPHLGTCLHTTESSPKAHRSSHSLVGGHIQDNCF